jgi:hypothetical protein
MNLKSTLFQNFNRVIGRHCIGCEIDDGVANRIGPHPFAVLIAPRNMMRLQLIEQCVPPICGLLAVLVNKNALVADDSFRDGTIIR